MSLTLPFSFDGRQFVIVPEVACQNDGDLVRLVQQGAETTAIGKSYRQLQLVAQLW